MKPNAQQCDACGDVFCLPPDPYDSCPSCGNAVLRDVHAIATIRELSEHVGAAHPTVESIAHRLFKDTECGVTFSVHDDQISVGGYCEGGPDLAPYHLTLGRFTPDQFDQAVLMADRDGCRAFDLLTELGELTDED